MHRSRPPLRRRLAIALSGLLMGGTVLAQSGPTSAGDGLVDVVLKLRLDPRLSSGTRRLDRQAARFLFADSISGVLSERISARGEVMLRQRGLVITADAVDVDQTAQTVVATGRVKIDRDGDTATGPRLTYDLANETGTMQTPTYALIKKERRRYAARGSARHVLFGTDDRDQLTDATYTTCSPANDDWVLKVAQLEIDSSRATGSAQHATVYFKDVPILYAPYLTFPLNNDRKSGFLAPTAISSNRSGFQFWLPYYWNLAENRDATLTSKLLTRRGLAAAGEFRYLEPTYAGQLDAEVLPNDRVARRDRSFFSIRHTQQVAPARVSGWNLAINAQRASDDDYFRDLTTRLQLTSQVNLPRDAILSYGNEHWGFTARTLAYQTLQDLAAPTTPPYRLLPSLTLVGDRTLAGGLSARVETEATDYRHPTLVSGSRLTLYPRVSWPITRASGFLTPKFGYHITRYRLDENLQSSDGLDYRGNTRASRSLPIFSLDGGLFFERAARLMGAEVTQTLEPRAYFVRIPYREQSRLPIFATAASDFNFAQLFTENQFIGQDRINDANQLTLAATSRFIDERSGEERLAAAIGQRFYFESPKVTLNGAATEVRRTDLLASLLARPWTHWTVESALQYNTVEGRVEKGLLTARYAPRPAVVLNAAYRYTRADLRQVDLSAQWPVAAGWNALARWNYSFRESKLVEGLAGFEYNSGCWQVRALLHRFITSTQQVSTSVQLQLELNGLGRIGINPLETLRQNIAGYKRSDEIDR
jgi:LPS-assembly protein